MRGWPLVSEDDKLYLVQDAPHFWTTPDELTNDFGRTVQRSIEIVGVQCSRSFHTSCQQRKTLLTPSSKRLRAHVMKRGEASMSAQDRDLGELSIRISSVALHRQAQ